MFCILFKAFTGNMLDNDDDVVKKSNLKKKSQNNGYYLLLIYRTYVHFNTNYFFLN